MPSRARRAAAAALLLLASACDRACPRRAGQTLDLLAAFGEADLRADGLDLPALAADPFFEKRGFGPLEGRGASRLAWMLGGSSRLRLPFHTTGDKELRLTARCHESLGPSLELAVSLNDSPLGSIVLTPADQELRIALPSALQVRGDNVLAFVSPRRREPGPGDADRRALVAAVSRLEVRPLGTAARPALPTLQDGRLLLTPGSSVGYYLRLPAGARLRGELVGGGAGALARLVAEDDAHRASLAELPASPRGSGLDVSLADRAGAILRLELASEGESALSVPSLRLESPGRGPAPRGPVAGLPARPNLIVYLVDTLRADVLGAYGV